MFTQYTICWHFYFRLVVNSWLSLHVCRYNIIVCIFFKKHVYFAFWITSFICQFIIFFDGEVYFGQRIHSPFPTVNAGVLHPVTGQFADKSIRGQSSRVLINSRRVEHFLHVSIPPDFFLLGYFPFQLYINIARDTFSFICSVALILWRVSEQLNGEILVRG